LPPGWRWNRLADVAVPGAPILYGILQPGPNVPGGVPYVRPTEIVGDTIELDTLRRTTREIAKAYRRSFLKSEDIVLSIVGTIGKVAIVPAELEGGNITQSSVRIRVRSDVATPQYIAYVLRSPVLRRQFDAQRLGTAVPRLNVAHVRALQIPIAPMVEQSRIVAEIEKQFTQLEAGVAALRRVEANLKRYRTAVLSAAAYGTLVINHGEVKQSDRGEVPFESGKALLVRILAERGQRQFSRSKITEPVQPPITSLPALPESWAWATLEQICPCTE
jgi:type I restriction enzyme S subunit